MKLLHSHPRQKGLGKPRILAAGLLLCIPASATLAQKLPPVVAARALVSADGAYPGSSIKAAVVADVSPGFHINDHQPTLDYLIPTELKLEVGEDLTASKLVYPKGQARKFEFADTPLSVYEGTFAVVALLKVARTAAPGIHTIKGKLAYQACNQQACFPPASVPVTLEIKVVPRGVTLKRLNTDVFGKLQID